MKICEKDFCTGCGACRNVCPKNCITMDLDEEGFYKYNVNSDLCINCGLCIKVCPSNGYTDVVKKNEPLTYLCWNLNNEIRKESSSGGVFTLLAEKVLDNNGVVFGVEFDKNFKVRHVGITKKSEVRKFRGSKYIQSNTGKTYKEVKSCLYKGREVLYSGTPCQIAGLYNFLGKDYKNLITCDVICHGVCSTKVYTDILNHYEHKYNSKIVDIKYRDKKTGWKNSSVRIEFESGKVVSEIRQIALLTYGFAVGVTNSKTCSMCKHALIPRRADLTLGDYGANDYKKYDKKDIKAGISVMVVNSMKGIAYFELIKNNMFYEEKAMDLLLEVQKNIAESNKAHPMREKFFRDYKNKSFKEIKKIYLTAPMKNKLIYKVGRERYLDIRIIVKKIVDTFVGKKHDS